MTDKVQKIRKEVEKLHGNPYYMMAVKDALAIIDSLQEEPVSRTPSDVESAMQEVKEKSRAFTEAHKGESSDEILAQMRGEEPVSEDLESEVRKYAPIYYKDGDISKLAHHFVNWQKQKMMKDAIKGYVNQVEYPGSTWIELSDNPKDLKNGDNVKIKIIKED